MQNVASWTAADSVHPSFIQVDAEGAHVSVTLRTQATDQGEGRTAGIEMSVAEFAILVRKISEYLTARM